MYPLAVVGNNVTARAALVAANRIGFDDATWLAGSSCSNLSGATTLPANLTRIVTALQGTAGLDDLGHVPDRQQVRLARSGFLVSELPLGQFSRDRYGAPLVNIEQADWPRILPVQQTFEPHRALSELEREFAAVVICDQRPATETRPTHTLHHAQLPFNANAGNANITWLGRHQCAWQLSTKQHLHVYFSLPLKSELNRQDWHPLLHDAIQRAAVQFDFNPFIAVTREQWHSGSVVYAGEACSVNNPYLPESAHLGLEDAWVLSRMLENYEEDIHDGLAEYEKYRRPRTARIAQAAAETALQMNRDNPGRRLLHHLNVALSTRFLPEIAMHRVDWLYNYDCIKGFR